MSKTFYALAWALLTLALSAPLSTPAANAQAGATFVGPVGDGGATITVATDGEQFTAYVCNSAQLADWFQGPLSVVSEAVSDSGSHIGMRFVNGAPVGVVTTADGTYLWFTTEAQLPDPDASHGDLVQGGSGVAVSGSCSTAS